MPDRIRLDDDQLESLAQSIAAKHPCRFNQHEAEALHYLGQCLHNGGREKFATLLDFGGTLMQAKAAGVRVTVTAVILGVIGLIVAGFWAKLKGMMQ